MTSETIHRLKSNEALDEHIALSKQPIWIHQNVTSSAKVEVKIEVLASVSAYGPKSGIMLVEYLGKDGSLIPGSKPLSKGKLGYYLYLSVEGSGLSTFTINTPSGCSEVRLGFASWNSVHPELRLLNNVKLKLTSPATKPTSPPTTVTTPASSVVAGRAAATPEAPEDQSEALLWALFGELGPVFDDLKSAPRIAGIFSNNLKTKLATQFVVDELMPTSLRGWLRIRRPDVIVVDQSALRSGAWCGTESTQGAALYREIDWVLKWAKEYDVPMYFVSTSNTPDVRTKDILDKASIVFPADNLSAGEPDVFGTPLTDVLNEYAFCSSEKGEEK